ANRKDEIERASDLDAEELRRRNAYDGDRPSIERDRSADDADRPSEPLLPQPIADDGRSPARTTASHIVSLREESSDDRRHTQRLEEVAARKEPIHLQRLAGHRERAFAAAVAVRECSGEG